MPYFSLRLRIAFCLYLFLIVSLPVTTLTIKLTRNSIDEDLYRYGQNINRETTLPVISITSTQILDHNSLWHVFSINF